MLFGIKCYTKRVLRQVHLSGGLVRVWVELSHQNGMTKHGASEWATVLGAKLRAFAEAYERLSSALLIERTGFSRVESRPFGYGVGWTVSSAQRRAIAEHFERSQSAELHRLARASPMFPIILSAHVEGNVIFCASLADEKETVGTGYGTSRTTAEFSALRSLRRIQDHGSASKDFLHAPLSPKIVRLTPGKTEKWLEVIFFGDINIRSN